MKNLLITIMCIVLGAAAMAQTEHLKFKGIPMDCSVDEIARKLQAKGLKYDDKKDDGTVFMSGTFAGTSNCTVVLIPIDGGTKIRRIGVGFPECNNWNCLIDKYTYLKDMLTRKYSKPLFVTEKFEGYSQPNNDNDKMYEVRMDRCKYKCEFYLANGWISLKITTGYDAQVFLIYEDDANAKANEQNILDDL